MKRPQASLESPLTIARASEGIESVADSTYPFASVGRRFSVHPSCDLRRSVVGFMTVGNRVVLERHVRLDVPLTPTKAELAISDWQTVLHIGQRATVLAVNRIQIKPQ